MNHPAPTPGPVWRDPRAQALLLAAALTTMANATISPALPGLVRLFADEPGADLLTRLLVPAPSVTVVLAAPLIGVAADRVGRRGLLRAGVILFVLSGCAGLVLPDLHSIFASRLALGLAVAMIMTTQTALVGDLFEGERRQALTGLQVSARNFGGLAFISLAGWLAALSPRLPFAVYGLAALFLPLIWQAIDEPVRRASPPRTGRADAGDDAPWLPAILALATLQMATNLIFFVIPTQLPFWLDGLGHDSAGATGAALAALMLTGGLTALTFARLRRAAGHAGAFALGYLTMAAGFLVLSDGAGIGVICSGAALVGVGYALVTPNFVALALAVAPAARAGVAGGFLTTSVFVGQIASPFASQAAIRAAGYDGTFLGIAGTLGLLGVVAAASATALRLRSARLPENSAHSR